MVRTITDAGGVAIAIEADISNESAVLTAAVVCGQRAASTMVENNIRGSIVNTTSVH